jgi:hypothetical protein
MSKSTRYFENLTKWLGDNADDPATKVSLPSTAFKPRPLIRFQDFLPRLQDHILARLLDLPYDGDDHNFSDADRRTITFVNNRIYKHKTIRINYTTYDVRRAQDSLNPRTHADFMCLSHEDQDDASSHPYWYGRIVGIFHALIRHVGPRSKSTEIQRVDFLWVRWFGRDLSHKGGWQARRLHRLGFIHGEESDAFSFLDPDEIIRGAHLIPAFAHGVTDELLGPSIARQDDEGDKDWRYFYVGMYVHESYEMLPSLGLMAFRFVDRDMVMRYLGGGVGHKTTSHSVADGMMDEFEHAAEGDSGNNTETMPSHSQDEAEDSDTDSEGDGKDFDDSEDDRSSVDPEDGEGYGTGHDLLHLEGYGDL